MEERSVEATQETAGEALLYRNIIADTRYSKICGGLRETFNNVWEDFSPPYLPSGLDYNNCEYKFQNWRDYILHSPECFCNPMVFRYPDYLADVERFFRWEIAYNEDELAEIIRTKSGSDVREISELIPRQRGFSGRINKLQISGDCDRLMNGELNIRRVLSPSHLPSSCFITEIKKERVILKGAGWGHGVGMCQMGALNMALLGKSYKEILQHYYPKTKLVKLLQPE
jgi:SpoIID/LytB domain protein